MASSTLLYIAWPLTLGLSFIAGGMILSNKSTTQNSKNDDQTSKVSRRNSPSNGSTNKNFTATNRRSSASLTLAGKDGYAESYDIKEIANIKDSHERLTNFLRMIDQLGPGDFEQVVADYRGLDKTARRIFDYEILIEAWAKINPEGALAYAKENIRPPFTSATILTTWAKYAPDAAINWLKLNHKGDTTSPYLADIIRGITIANPERATTMIQELPSARRYGAILTIASHVDKLGSEKSIAWLATIKDEKLHTAATNRITSLFIKKDPQGAVDWLRTLPVETLNKYAGSVAYAWAKQDIDKAVEWTNSLQGKTRTNAARLILTKFVSSDPNKAATWLKTMSDETGYQDLVSNFMDSTRFEHPELALANLDQLSSSSLRNHTRKISLTAWAAKDKAAATLWMQNNNVDTATQKKVLSDHTKDSYRRPKRLW